MRWKTDTTKKSVPIVMPVNKHSDTTKSSSRGTSGNRDSKGKFIRGSIPVNKQDKTTGRFTSTLKTIEDHVTPVKDRHSTIADQVDKL